MHIGVDVDGVMRRLMHSLRREYLKDYPEKEDQVVPADDVEYWDIRKLAPDDESGLGKELEVYCLEQPDTAYRCFRNADPFPGSIEAMGRLYHDAKFNDHVVSICTSQYYPWQKEATLEWLHDYNVPFDNVIMTGTGKGHFGLDIHLDDRVKNCVAVEQNGGVGVLKKMNYNEEPWANGGWKKISHRAPDIDEFRVIVNEQTV